MKTILLPAVLAIGLCGCSTIATLIGGGSVAQTQPATIMAAEKGLTITHLAYQGIGYGLKAAAQSGALHGANAATAQAWYDKAGDALDVANKADEALNAQGIMDAVSKANDAIAQADAIVHPKP